MSKNTSSSEVIKISSLYKEYYLGSVGRGTLYRDLQSFWAKVRNKPDPNSLIDIVSEVCETINGKKPLLGTDGGTSDARFIKDYCKVLEIGIVNNTLHKVDENVQIKDIQQLEEIYFQILKKYFNKD